MDCAQKLREYIPQGDGYNSEFAQDLTSAACEIDRLREVIKDIAEMTDADNPESYRCDDREGCFDTVFSVATEALKTPNVKLTGSALLRSPG